MKVLHNLARAAFCFPGPLRVSGSLRGGGQLGPAADGESWREPQSPGNCWDTSKGSTTRQKPAWRSSVFQTPSQSQNGCLLPSLVSSSRYGMVFTGWFQAVVSFSAFRTKLLIVVKWLMLEDLIKQPLNFFCQFYSEWGKKRTTMTSCPDQNQRVQIEIFQTPICMFFFCQRAV